MKKYYIMLATAITTHLSFGQIILEQGFETNNVLSSNCNSSNWCNTNGQVTASSLGITAHSGSLFYRPTGGGPGQNINESLLSSVFNKGIGNATFGFWFNVGLYNGGENAFMRVSLLNSSGANLLDFVSNNEPYLYNSNQWMYKEFTIPSGFTGDFQIEFANIVSYKKVYIDDILLVGPQGTTNVSELFSKQFKIYNDLGNSSEIKVAFAHDLNNLNISVVNMMGQTVYIKETNAVGGQTETLNTGELQSGIYFVNVESEGQMFTQKIKI